jgi:flagellar motor switch protein FliN/FliY
MSDMSIANNLHNPESLSVEKNFDLLSDISLRVSVEVGSTSISIGEISRLAEGGVIELDRQANDLLDILANGTLVAKGEIVTVDGRYGIRIIDVVSSERRAKGLERRS